VGDVARPGRARPVARAEDDRRVGVDDIDPLRAHEPLQRVALVGQLARQPAESERREVLAAQHRERPGQDLDSRPAQIVGERPLERQHDERVVALRVQRRGQQQQLAVRPVAPGRRVQVEDAPGHAST
jgi:hypothetical protein